MKLDITEDIQTERKSLMLWGEKKKQMRYRIGIINDSGLQAEVRENKRDRL